MMPIKNSLEIDGFVRETVDMARGALGENGNRTPRVAVPLSDGRVPDKVVGRVKLFYFKKGGWVPKAVPLKKISDGKDAHEGFLHWVAFRTFQVVGGIFRFLIWQSLQQYSEASGEISVAVDKKREWLNALIIQNPRDTRFATINKIFLKRRDLFRCLEREALFKIVIGVALIASVVLLGAGVLAYQPTLLYAGGCCGAGALLGMGYFSFRSEDSFSGEARDILGTQPPDLGSPQSRSQSVSSDTDLPPSYSAQPGENPTVAEKPMQPAQTPGATGCIVLGADILKGTPTASSDGSGFEHLL